MCKEISLSSDDFLTFINYIFLLKTEKKMANLVEVSHDTTIGFAYSEKFFLNTNVKEFLCLGILLPKRILFRIYKNYVTIAVTDGN